MRNKLLFLLLAFSISAFGAGGFRQYTNIPSLSNDADGIAASQSITSSATLNGSLSSSGVATLAAAQIVTVTSAGNDTGVLFTITGTSADGETQTDSFAGANASTSDSSLYFKTVTDVGTNSSTASTVTIGTDSSNGAVSETLIPELNGYDPAIGIGVDVTGTLTYTVDHTFYSMPKSTSAKWYDTVGLVGNTADDESNIMLPVGGVRARITSYTSGSVNMIILQGRIQ